MSTTKPATVQLSLFGLAPVAAAAPKPAPVAAPRMSMELALRQLKITGPACISFSGGRTSAFMLWLLLAANGGRLPPDVHVIFANTGKEHPGTLHFVWQCGEFWGVPIAFLEYDGRGGMRDFREVTYETASRDGQPFETAIQRKYALPNVAQRWCTQVLKVERIRAFMRSRGYETWSDYVGLRADEPARVAKRRAAADDEVTYELPLAAIGVTVEHVRDFWSRQSFDLEIPSDAGNCTLCFMKGTGTIRDAIARDPAEADWWIEQERRTGRQFLKNTSFRELRDSALVPIERLTGRELAIASNTDDARPCACTD